MPAKSSGVGLAATLEILDAIETPDQAESISALRDIVTGLSNDVASLNLEEIVTDTIPKAVADLETTVSETAAAVDRIMDATEKVDAGAGEATMDIYEACSFQDITGQRMTNVASALQDVRTKMDGLLAALDGRLSIVSSDVVSDPAQVDLLNGPQLPGAGSSQDDVDALLAEFDSK